MRITASRFQIPDQTGVREFYCEILGMAEYSSDEDCLCFGYGKQDCQLEFVISDCSPYEPSRQDFFWKHGITVGNLDTACNWLASNNVPVSEPRQFRDIGYLAHITDPNGFSIELLQHGFEGNEKPVSTGHAIGSQATLAHITLRVSSIEPAQRFLVEELGMQLMSVQPVTPFGFTLYFYGWSKETLPDPDLQSVNNRKWLWERPYTLIELQYLEMPDVQVITPDDVKAGYAGLSVVTSDGEEVCFSVDELVEKLL